MWESAGILCCGLRWTCAYGLTLDLDTVEIEKQRRLSCNTATPASLESLHRQTDPRPGDEGGVYRAWVTRNVIFLLERRPCRLELGQSFGVRLHTTPNDTRHAAGEDTHVLVNR